MRKKISNTSKSTTIISYYGKWYATFAATASGEVFTRNTAKTGVSYKLNINHQGFASYSYRLNSSEPGDTLKTCGSF